MDINLYNTYSILSESANTDSQKIKEIINKAELLQKMPNIAAAKEFIKENWNITGSVKSHLLAADCFLNIKESKDLYVVNFVCKNENISYYFNK